MSSDSDNHTESKFPEMDYHQCLNDIINSRFDGGISEILQKTSFHKDNHLAVRLMRLARNNQSNYYHSKENQINHDILTKALTLAETDVVLASIYAARAKLSHEAKFYEICIKDVSRALSFSECPEGLKTDMRELKLKSEKEMKEYTEREPPKTRRYHEKAPAINDTCRNSKISSGAGAIKIEKNWRFGRHIVAAENVEFGEILAVEKPFVFAVAPSGFLRHCHHCLKLGYDLIPCGGCTLALYCSETCRKGALDSYHRFECAIPEVVDFCRRRGFHVPFKTALMSREENLSELKAKPGEVYRSDRYKELHNLGTNLGHPDRGQFASYSLFVANAFRFVKEHTDYFRDRSEGFENKFREILMRQLQVFAVNKADITAVQSGDESKSIGEGLYSLYSLFNHSCCPNVERYYHGTTMVLRCIAPIKKGEQCFVSYGPLYLENSLRYRRKFLLEKYNFLCICEACLGDWARNPSYSRSIYCDDSNYYVGKFREERYKIQRGDSKMAKTMARTFDRRMKTAENEGNATGCKVFRELIRECYNTLGNWDRYYSP